MPSKPMKPCATPGCSALVRGKAHCPPHQELADARRAEHLKKVHASYNQKRDDSDQFYKSQAWQRFRTAYIQAHPLCVECQRYGRVKAAVIVDHIIPFKKAPERALDESNMRSLCRACHNRVGERVGLTRGEGVG